MGVYGEITQLLSDSNEILPMPKMCFHWLLRCTERTMTAWKVWHRWKIGSFIDSTSVVQPGNRNSFEIHEPVWSEFLTIAFTIWRRIRHMHPNKRIEIVLFLFFFYGKMNVTARNWHLQNLGQGFRTSTFDFFSIGKESDEIYASSSKIGVAYPCNQSVPISDVGASQYFHSKLSLLSTTDSQLCGKILHRHRLGCLGESKVQRIPLVSNLHLLGV